MGEEIPYTCPCGVKIWKERSYTYLLYLFSTGTFGIWDRLDRHHFCVHTAMNRRKSAFARMYLLPW
jgi:hypothetical protein